MADAPYLAKHSQLISEEPSVHGKNDESTSSEQLYIRNSGNPQELNELCQKPSHSPSYTDPQVEEHPEKAPDIFVYFMRDPKHHVLGVEKILLCPPVLDTGSTSQGGTSG